MVFCVKGSVRFFCITKLGALYSTPSILCHLIDRGRSRGSRLQFDNMLPGLLKDELEKRIDLRGNVEKARSADLLSRSQRREES